MLYIRYCSDLDYEEMVADICFDNQQIAIISQDGGVGNMKIEILPSGDADEALSFPLDEFINILSDARQKLAKMHTKFDVIE
ncbi:hypothetical protein [Estrella lausannensis]|uniref:Uncharacterized protein n=1 Tax=Estrella lausannensis TaxID=483423 RepID=A0A0H5DRI1_9BACT|nr:hypothetical protein [Estrella lausannensis]CRX38808.1 hypothetical protein ELAC_1475 [Estrella lausannensis]